MLAFAGRNHKRIAFRSLLLAIMLGAGTFTCYAVTPQNGYFTDTDLQPVGSATIETVETEPAIALVFAVDQKTAEITQQFNDWYLSNTRPDINVFAVAVNTENLSPEVVLEAINQRNLSFPVYMASSDILFGDAHRLFVLDSDRAVERFSTFEPAMVNAAIGRLGISVSTATPAATPAPAPEIGAPEPTPEPTPGLVETVTTTTTTVTETEVAEPSSVVQGGETTDNIYINDAYGFRVEFPPGWKYQVAARRDGAVAIEPARSEMDMRVWSIPAEDVSTPQGYIDQRLESLARKQDTRVNVERRFEVTEDGMSGLDVTYNFAKPIDPDAPMRGFLLHRGRIQVFVQDGYIKAASVDAPAGEYTAAMPMIESFFRSFEVQPADYTSPVL